MKKLTGFISLLCILNIVCLAGLIGFLFGTGRLDKPKAQAISDMLRLQGSPPHLREKIYEVMAPATQRAATTAPAIALGDSDERGPSTAEERNNYWRQIREGEQLRAENAAQNQQKQQDLLQNLQKNLEADRAKLDAEKKEFEKKLAEQNNQKDSASFQKMMTLFDELKPRQIKDLLAAMPQDVAAKYVAAMDPSQAAKIIGEFKSPEEKTFLGGLMNRLRTGGNDPGTGAASASASAMAASAATAAPAAP